MSSARTVRKHVGALRRCCVDNTCFHVVCAPDNDDWLSESGDVDADLKNVTRGRCNAYSERLYRCRGATEIVASTGAGELVI